MNRLHRRDTRPRGLGWRVVGSLPDGKHVRSIVRVFGRSYLLVSAFPVLVDVILGDSARALKTAIVLIATGVGLLLLCWIIVFATNFLWGQGRR